MLDQGAPEFLGYIKARTDAAAAFSLAPEDLHPDLPLEVVSTGLRCLIVPVRVGALETAKIDRDLTAWLGAIGAQFAVLFDPSAPEIRHWNNDGIPEDVATGSAAGTIGAYALRYGLARAGEEFILYQVRFTGRPSELRVTAHEGTVSVGGDVAFVEAGMLNAPPLPGR